MSDLISRQQAIDAIMGEYPDAHYPDWYAIKIMALSSAQPEERTEKRTESHACDLISRQAAIDALHTWFRDGFDEDKWWNSTHVLAAIEGLPSVQQERKWETCFECPLSHGCPKIKGCTNEQAIEYASQIPSDCPLPAQPERKKGEWLRYGEDGYPNNEDTVFWQCDQCLEQYTGRAKKIPNFCPNCGADMRGE